jgi:hypothetical protein
VLGGLKNPNLNQARPSCDAANMQLSALSPLWFGS